MEIISTNKFHNIYIKKYIPLDINIKENIYLLTIFTYYQEMISDKYNKLGDIDDLLHKHYNIRFGVSYVLIGTKINIVYTLYAVDPKYINDRSYNLDFLYNLLEELSKPLIKNNNFDLKFIKLAKKQFQIDSNDFYSSYIDVAYSKAFNLFFKDTVLDYFDYPKKDELTKISNTDVFNFYKKIKDFPSYTYVAGDVESTSFKYNIEKRDILLTKRGITNTKVIDKAKTENTYLNIIIDVNIFSSTPKKSISMSILNYILGEEPYSKLQEEVREKRGLCYSISSTYEPYYGIIVISSEINNKNIEKVIDSISIAIDNVLNGIDIEKYKKLFIAARKKSKDSIANLVKMRFQSEFSMYSITTDELISIINSLTIDDLKDVKNNLYNNRLIHIYGGVINE